MAVGVVYPEAVWGMDMNKNGLVAAVATISGSSKADAARAVDAVFNAITDASAGARMSAW